MVQPSQLYSSSSSSTTMTRTKPSRRSLNHFLLLTCAMMACVPPAVAFLPPAPVVHTMCGFVAGSAGAIAAYPIDFVKSQLQTEVGRAKYAGGMDAAKDIIQNSKFGIFALYRGVIVNVIGIAPEKTIKLSVNEAVRLAISAQYGYLPIVGEVIAGGCAGMTQVSVTNPLEVVKVKMQTSDMTFGDVICQFKSIADLYQGAGACIVRDVVFSSVLFPAYAHAKVAIAAAFVAMMTGTVGMDGDTATGAITFWSNMIAGSLAAAPAAAISTPADVVKTRMQQAQKQQLNDCIFADECIVERENFLDVFQTIVREEGPEVLFSGWFERVVRSVPQFGVTLAVFDVLSTMAVEHGWMAS